MNLPSELEKTSLNSIYEFHNNKTNTGNFKKSHELEPSHILNKKINVKCGKNFISKSSFKKKDNIDNEAESESNFFDNYTKSNENNNIYNGIIYYYESTCEYLRKSSDDIKSFNWKNSKNFKNVKYYISSSNLSSEKKVNQCDKREKKIIAPKEIGNKKYRIVDDNNNINNNLLTINDVNFNLNHNDLKKNNNCNNINEHEKNQGKNEYCLLNNSSLLNTKKTGVEFNDYVNYNMPEFKIKNFINFNNNITHRTNIKKTKINDINNITYEQNIDYPLFFPSNFNKDKNITQTNILNNKTEDICKLKPKEYLVKMFGRTGWICLCCENFNFETRNKCNRCGLKKNPKKIDEINKKKDEQIDKIGYNKNIDWFCNNYQFLNYNLRQLLNRYEEKKLTENKPIISPFSGKVDNNSSIIQNIINNSSVLNFRMRQFNL